MNAPGSPSSPLQTTYLISPLAARTLAHFRPVGKPAPPRPRSPLACIVFDDLMRRELFQAAAQGDEAVVPQVFVQIERIDLAAMLGGQVLLRPEERADRPVAGVDGVPSRRVAGFIGQQPIEPAARPIRPMRRNAPRGLKWASTMSAASSALTLAKSFFSPAADGVDDFDQRRLMAHADAADPFHHGRRAAFGQRVLDRPIDAAASLGDAARAEPDANLAHVLAENDRRGGPLAPCRSSVAAGNPRSRRRPSPGRAARK